MTTNEQKAPRSIKYRLIATVAVAALLAGSAGTFAAFTATTTNAGNSISAGTVVIGQHAGSTTMYSTATNAANKGPGAPNYVTKCVRVTYTGNMAASVKLFISTGVPANATEFALRVERAVGGTSLSAPAADMNCTGFGTGSVVTDAFGTSAMTTLLSTFPTTYAAGVVGKVAGAAWAQNDWVDYRFTIVPEDDATANAHAATVTAGTHTYTWQAENN